MSFVRRCVQDSFPIWEACLRSDFLRQLGEGTLAEACFKGYIVEDSLYLRECARVLAWGIIKAENMDAIRTLYSLLSFVNEGEGATRLQYLRRYGLRDEEVQRLPQRPENRSYTERMLLAAREGGMPECMMACLPCMLSYGWIFPRLLERFPQVRSTPYWPMVRDYAGESYAAACRRWAVFANDICGKLAPPEQERCLGLFRECSHHELRFWQMCQAARMDI